MSKLIAYRGNAKITTPVAWLTQYLDRRSRQMKSKLITNAIKKQFLVTKDSQAGLITEGNVR